MANRHIRRQRKATSYRAVALAGGGEREKARRAAKIANNTLRVENGLIING